MTPRLVIITEIIAPYRIPVFNALAKRPEIDLHVIFLAESDLTIRQWHVYKDEIKFSYEVLPSWRKRWLGYNILLNDGVFSALNKNSPDAILCGGYNYPASWQTAYWAQARRVPLLLWLESTALDRRGGHSLVEFMKRRFLNRCNAFVVPGKSSLDYLEELGISGPRIFTAPNAVDVSLFSELADKARRDEGDTRIRSSLPSRYFLCVGRLVRAKGIFDLLEAYSGLDEKIREKVGLVFAGDGPDRVELMKRASRITPGTIHCPGFVHREDLPEFYALADALIFPTHTDPWGLVVNEAMSCGITVIATDVAGCVASLVKDGLNGFVVSARDVTQLTRSMARLADNSGLRVEMGVRSRERIQAFTPTVWADGVVKATQSVLLDRTPNRISQDL